MQAIKTTVSATPIQSVTVEPHGQAASDVWLRRGIHQIETKTEGLPQQMWEAFEVHMVVPGHPTVAEVSETADELWWQAERSAMPYDEWRADVDNALLDLMEMVV